jgi:hypothetical protein
MEPKAVNDVWRTSSNRGTNKMDINRQMAMTDRANLTYTQLRVIRPFFIADKVNPLHSEHEIRKLELKSSHDPVFIQFKEDQYSRNGWYLPVNEVIKDWLEPSSSENNPSSTLHVILSADHGQGHWKANIACVLIDDTSNRVIKEGNTVIASVECRKDKRQVLLDSGVPAKINQLLHAAKQNAVGINTIPLKLSLQRPSILSSLAFEIEYRSDIVMDEFELILEVDDGTCINLMVALGEAQVYQVCECIVVIEMKTS